MNNQQPIKYNPYRKPEKDVGYYAPDGSIDIKKAYNNLSIFQKINSKLAIVKEWFGISIDPTPKITVAPTQELIKQSFLASLAETKLSGIVLLGGAAFIIMAVTQGNMALVLGTVIIIGFLSPSMAREISHGKYFGEDTNLPGVISIPEDIEEELPAAQSLNLAIPPQLAVPAEMAPVISTTISQQPIKTWDEDLYTMEWFSFNRKEITVYGLSPALNAMPPQLEEPSEIEQIEKVPETGPKFGEEVD